MRRPSALGRVLQRELERDVCTVVRLAGSRMEQVLPAGSFNYQTYGLHEQVGFQPHMSYNTLCKWAGRRSTGPALHKRCYCRVKVPLINVTA